MRFRFVRPTVPAAEEWLPYLEPAIRAAHYTNFGPVAAQLEERIAAAYGRPGRAAILASSATSALTATLLALELRGPVVVPSFTFPATVQAIIGAGCSPVFCEVDPDTWELSPAALRRLVAEQPVVGVMPVRVYGLCRSLAEIDQIAATAGLPVVVDAAAALGGRLRDGTLAGQAGTAEVFSLHATKVFGIGEGGVVLADPGLVQRIRRCLNFGLDGGRVTALGLNGKLSELHAAVGLAVFDRLDRFVARRTAVAERYVAMATRLAGVSMPADPGRPPWQTFPIALPAATDLPRLVEALAAAGLETRPYYSPPLHRYALFGHTPHLPVTDDVSSRVLCLPVYSDMTEDEVAEIERTFTRVWYAHRG